MRCSVYFFVFSMFKNILFQFEMDVMVSLTRMCAPVPNVEQVWKFTCVFLY